MKKLIICLLITLTGLLGQNALAQGSLVTQNGLTGTELSSDLLSSYLKDICGAKSTTSNSWSITGIPQGKAGDVYFVDVNNFWKGNGSASDVETQIKLGVKAISKVDTDSKHTTSTGTFYTHPASNANKFFFIVRRDSRRSASNTSYGNLAFSWYDEWSYVKPNSSGSYESGEKGYNNLTATWEQLKDGEPFPSPHNCQTSLATNHYIALKGKDPTEQNPITKEWQEVTGYNFTAYLYIPTADVKYNTGSTYYISESNNFWGTLSSTNDLITVLTKTADGEYVTIAEAYPNMYYATRQSYGDNYQKVQGYTRTDVVTASSNIPYVFFYAVKLNDVPDADVTKKSNYNADQNPYNVTLHWSTAFDKHQSYDASKDTKYDGMKEHYVVERSYDNTSWAVVTDEIVLPGTDFINTTKKTTIDEGLMAFNTISAQIGYTVYYRVTSYVEKEGGTMMSKTISNVVPVDIPGTSPFKLSLEGAGSSVYNPTTVQLTDEEGSVYYEGPTNTFTNTIVSAESKVTGADKVTLVNGSTLGLYMVDKDGNPVKLLKEVKVADASEYADLQSLANLIDNTSDDGNNGKWKDEARELPAGDDYTAAYQLILTFDQLNEESNIVKVQKKSNIVRIQNPSLKAKAVKAHRSGYPDAATCAGQNPEVFHNEIMFYAAANQIGTGYYIYRDVEADKLPFMILDYTDNGFVDRNNPTKAPYVPDLNGMISIADLHTDEPIAEGETGTGNSIAWNYSVAFFNGENTYGSQLAPADYVGEIGELAVELSVDLRAYLVQKSNDLYVEARLTWNPSKSSYSDAVPATDEAYDVYVSIEDTHGDDAKNANPSTDGFVKWNAVSFNGEATETTFTDIYTSKRQMEDGRFTEADRQKMLEVLKSYKFYVKMKTTEGGIKNSAVVTPTAQAGANGIYTALGDIEAADMDVKVVNGVVEVNGVTGAIKVVNAAGALVAEAEGNGDVTEIAGLTTGVYVVTAPNMKPTKILIK